MTDGRCTWGTALGRFRWLVVIASLFAVSELIDGVVSQVPAGTRVRCGPRFVHLVGLRSRGWPRPTVLGVFAAIEFLLVVFVHSRGEDPAAWRRLVLVERSVQLDRLAAVRCTTSVEVMTAVD